MYHLGRCAPREAKTRFESPVQAKISTVIPDKRATRAPIRDP